MSFMIVVSVPWSKRPGALPVLTMLAPHEKTNQALGQRHKTSIDWVRQMTSQVRAWLPERSLVLITDGGLIAVRLGLRCNRYRHPVTFVSRLHLNIRLFDPPQPKAPANGENAPPRPRQPTLQAHLITPTPAGPSRLSPGMAANRGKSSGSAGQRSGTPPARKTRCPSAGAGPRSGWQVQGRCFLLHRPDRQCRADYRLVRAALECRSHLSRMSCPSWL